MSSFLVVCRGRGKGEEGPLTFREERMVDLEAIYANRKGHMKKGKGGERERQSRSEETLEPK